MKAVYPVTRAALKAYADASGDQNPIHQDEAVAKAVGLPDVIAHGMFTLALVGRAVAEWFPDAEVLEIGGKFTNPVVVPETGAEVTVELTGRADGVLSLEVTSGGVKVLGNPKVTLRV